MIRVTVELLPHGSEEGKRTLGTLDIHNDASGDLDIGNYVGELNAEYTLEGMPRRGKVFCFKRREQSCWTLVGAFLKLFGHTSHSPSKMEKL